MTLRDCRGISGHGAHGAGGSGVGSAVSKLLLAATSVGATRFSNRCFFFSFVKAEGNMNRNIPANKSDMLKHKNDNDSIVTE